MEYRGVDSRVRLGTQLLPAMHGLGHVFLVHAGHRVFAAGTHPCPPHVHTCGKDVGTPMIPL